MSPGKRVLAVAVLAIAIGTSSVTNVGSETRAGEVAFAVAMEEAEAGKAEEALANLEKALGQGYESPSDILSRLEFETLLADSKSRERIHELLRNHTRESQVTMVRAGEPGDRLRVRGQLVDSKTKKPVRDGILYLYQTDAEGLYRQGQSSGGGSGNPRLFAFVAPDKNGRFELLTIVPGSYPGQRISKHIHYVAEAPGYSRVVREVIFDEEPRPSSRTKSRAEQSGISIVTRKKAEDGVQEIQVTFRLDADESS